MKFVKSLALISSLSLLGYLSFNITYERVSAIVLEEAEERKKSEIVIKPILVDDIEEEKEEPKTEEVEKEKLKVRTNDFIFIGDSRLDSLKNVSSNINFNSVHFITSENADCNWMRNTGLYELNNILNSTNGYYNIVFNPGISDLYNVNKYIDFFNELSNRYPNQNIFVLGVGPLDEAEFIKNNISIVNEDDIYNDDFHVNNNEESDVNNTDITENNDNILNENTLSNSEILANANMANNDDIYNFNIDIMKNINDDVHMIYTFQELMLSGYKTIDGYHLDESTSNSILKFIYNQIQSLQP